MNVENYTKVVGAVTKYKSANYQDKRAGIDLFLGNDHFKIMVGMKRGDGFVKKTRTYNTFIII